MNLHQFRFVQEAVRRNLNLTETAKALYTSQPGDQQGDPRTRGGTRRRHLRPPRQAAAPRHRARAAGAEGDRDHHARGRQPQAHRRASSRKQDAGTLSIATTHTQARYLLPEPVAQLRRRYPKVNVSLHQGTPEQVARMLLDDVAEIGLATESLADIDDLVTLPCYEWQHVMVRAGRPSAGRGRAADARATGGRTADHLPPDVHRPHAHRPGLRARAAEAERGARGDRLRRHQDLCAAGPGRRHRRRDGGARRPAGRRPGVAARSATCSARTSTRVAFKRGAYLRNFVLHLRRAAVRPPRPRPDRSAR